MIINMRTTLTIEPDVAERIRKETASGRKSLKEVVNEGLRRGLSDTPVPQQKLFKIIPHSSAYRPGVDRLKLGALSDELEAESFLTSLGNE